MNDWSSSELGLEELQWLRRLALSLVRDPNEADDAVQETVLAALTRRPLEVASLGAWLAGVLRNAVRQGRRAEARRTRRERAVQVPDSSPSTFDALQELGRQRALVDLVHALEEPYRTTIVLRFLRGKSAREIAREQEIPVKTVHTRVQRGLARLRSALDRQHGGSRRAWVIGLLPLTTRKAGALGLASGAAVVPMQLKLLTSAALALAVLVAVPFALRDPALPSPELAPSSGGALATLESPPGIDSRPAQEALRARPAVESAPAPLETHAVADAVPDMLLAGFVLALDGSAIADVEVLFERERAGGFGRVAAAASTRSNSDGSFALALPDGLEGPGRLVVDDSHWSSVSLPYVGERGDPSGAEPLLVVVAPSVDYSGRVVDERGGPIAGARVAVTLDGEALRSFDVGGATVNLRVPLAATDSGADGSFSLRAVGFVEGAFAHARRDGFEEAQAELDGAPHFDLELVLPARTPVARAIHGRVEDELGSPLEDVVVSLGWNSIRSGPTGCFTLELEDWQQAGVLRAARPGLGATQLAFDWREEGAGKSAADPLRITLAQAAPSLRGRVLDDAGAAVEGALVWTPDTTHLGNVVHRRGAQSIVGTSTVEAFLTGLQAPWEQTVDGTTDARGEFELSGVLDRPYAVFAMNPRTLAIAGPVMVRPGSEASLTLGARETGRIAGHIRTTDGTPIAGVRISLERSVEWTRPTRELDPWAGSPRLPPGAERRIRDIAVSDSDGWFSIEGVVVERARLGFESPALFLPRPVLVDEVADPSAIEVVRDARSTFRLSLIDPSEADAYWLADDEGQHQVLFVHLEDTILSAAEVPLVEGRSSAAYTKAGQQRVMLTRDGALVRSATIVLPPGGVHQLEL